MRQPTKRSPRASLDLRAQIFAHRFDNSLDIFDGPDLEFRSLRSTFEDRVFGGFLVAEGVAGHHHLSSALHLRHDDIEQEWGYPLPGRRLWIRLRYRATRS